MLGDYKIPLNIHTGNLFFYFTLTCTQMYIYSTPPFNHKNLKFNVKYATCSFGTKLRGSMFKSKLVILHYLSES